MKSRIVGVIVNTTLVVAFQYVDPSLFASDIVHIFNIFLSMRG
jgi:hypothetical protein